MVNHTTKRFARTISEAFPGGTEYARSVEHYRRSDYSGIGIALTCCAALAMALLAFWLRGGGQ